MDDNTLCLIVDAVTHASGTKLLRDDNVNAIYRITDSKGAVIFKSGEILTNLKRLTDTEQNDKFLNLVSESGSIIDDVVKATNQHDHDYDDELYRIENLIERAYIAGYLQSYVDN